MLNKNSIIFNKFKVIRMHIEKQYRELEQIEEVRVYNINIVNGYSGSLGGAIYNQGNVNISNSTFKNCYSNDGGNL